MSTVPSASDAGKDQAENDRGDTGSLGGMLTGKTKGIQNIEGAFDRAGGTKHHVPGEAGKLGSNDPGAGNDPGIRKEEPSAIGQFARDMLDNAGKTVGK